MDKRDVAITIKISKADLAQLEHTAKRLWPDAIISRSSMVLSLAKLGARLAIKYLLTGGEKGPL